MKTTHNANNLRRATALARGNNKTAFDAKVSRVMDEFSRGRLHSSSGERVKSRSQAIAIALSEARSHALGDKA